jgi:hypothetical protein
MKSTKIINRRSFIKFSLASISSTLACGLLEEVKMSEVDRFFKGNTLNKKQLSLLFEFQDFQIYGSSLPASRSIDLWKESRGKVDETGFWPVLIGDVDSMEKLRESLEYQENVSPIQIMDMSNDLDLEKWLNDQKDMVNEGGSYSPPHGDWPEGPQFKDVFVVQTSALRNRPVKDLIIAFIPTKSGWQAPAYLKFGGWNYCPAPEVHTSISNKWEHEYGAEIVVMTDDTIEFLVSKPPQSTSGALKLAEEQFLYCSDIVYQGTGTLEGLAATLLNNHNWYFWWD